MLRTLLRWAAETAVAVVILIASAELAYRYLADREVNAFGDLLQHSLMVACGHGLITPVERTAALTDFLRRNRTAVTCEDVIGADNGVPPGNFVRNHRYLIYTTALPLRVGSLSWRTLDVSLALAYGGAIVLVYVFYRIIVAAPLALLGTGVVAFSDQMHALSDYRDFAKAPWFFAMWALMAWFVWRAREGTARARYGWAATAGALAGIGLGFRTDLSIAVPAFAVAFLVAPLDAREPSRGTHRALVAASFVLAFLLTGSPILTSMSAGSNTGHVAVLGLTTNFTEALGLRQTTYDLGDIYADGFGRSVIAAHGVIAQRKGRVDDLGTAEYDRTAMRALVDVARHFPADILMRVFAAATRSLEYPFSAVSRETLLAHPALETSPRLPALAQYRSRMLSWIEGWTGPTAVVVITALAMREPRLAVATAMIGLWFYGVGAAQFSRRHVFHLDVLSIGLVLTAINIAVWAAYAGVRASIRRRAASGNLRRRAAAGFATVGAMAIGVGVPIAAAREWQHAHLVDVLAASLAADWAEVALTTAPFDGLDNTPPRTPIASAGFTLLRIDTAAPRRDGPADFAVAVFLLEAGAVRCGANRLEVVAAFASVTPTYDWNYTRVFDLPLSGGEATRLIYPAYWWPGHSQFVGFAVPSASVSCVARILRAKEPHSLPVPIVVARLAPGWQGEPLYQTFGPTVPLPSEEAAAPPPAEAAVGAGGSTPEAVRHTFDDAPPLPQVAPPLEEWTRLDGVSLESQAGGTIVHGNDRAGEYQLVSPPLSVPPHTHVDFRVAGAMHQGYVCLGVLEGTQQRWLLPPDGGHSILRVNTGTNARVVLVFANCAPAARRIPAVFTVARVTYGERREPSLFERAR